jgi:hypothetical protein
LGGFFRSIWRFGSPLLSKLARQPLVRDIGKAAASTALDLGTKAVADALEGKKSLKQGLGEGVEVAKREVAEALRGSRRKRQAGAGGYDYSSSSESDDFDEGDLAEAAPRKRARKRKKQAAPQAAPTTTAPAKRKRKVQVGGGRGRRPKYAGLFQDSPAEDEYGGRSRSPDSEH